MKRAIIVAAAVLMSATGAIAEEPAAEVERPERKVCRSVKMTGSLTRVRRTCLTQAEWDRVSDRARGTVAGLDRNSNQATIQDRIGTEGGGGGW